MPTLATLLLPLALAPQGTTAVGSARTPAPRVLSGVSSTFDVLEVANGFGVLLPHLVLANDGVGGPGPAVVHVRSFDDLVANVVPGVNEVLPPARWPVTATLPNGLAGNHFLLARFDQPLDVASVLDGSASAATTSHLTGALVVVAVDPATGATTPIPGRAFVDGRTYGAPDPNDPGRLLLEAWVGLDGVGKPVALDVGGATPGAGFPGTEDVISFAGANYLITPGSFVFVPDADGDLTTHETFPVGRQVRVVLSQAIAGRGGRALAARGLATSTVGPDALEPGVATAPGGFPRVVPGNGDIDVDPSTDVRVSFDEPVRLSSIGPLDDGGPGGVSPAVRLTFGPPSATTTVPFSVSVDSVYDLSEVVLRPAFAFPGAGAAGSCGSFSQVDVTVVPGFVQDLAGNVDPSGASTFFETGEGPGLVNAPVVPDAIYVARFGAVPGISVIDLNGFGASTGDPTYDPVNPIAEGNSNYPNNPNVALQGSLLSPPLQAGSCTFDGGSAGVFTLTRDSNLSDLLARAPVVTSVVDLALGAALDLSFNAAVPFGCQSGGGNLCAATGLKQVLLGQGGANSCAPAGPGNPPVWSLPPGASNLASWAPHPNPPPLVFPPLCLSPAIGGQEPTSVVATLPPPEGPGLFNLLVPGSNYLGNPAFALPPSSLLAREQNGWFQGPSLPQASVAACRPYMLRQQIGQFLYVADRAAGEVVVLNSNRFTVLERIEIPDPTAFAMSPNLDFLAVTSQGSNSLHFVDVDPVSSTFHEVVQVTPVGAAPAGVAWEPGNEDVLVCNAGDSTISIVSAFDFQVRKTLTGAIGGGSSLVQPFDLAITPRQDGFGWGRNTYFAWVLDRAGQLALFESGPDGVNGWGYDDLVGVVPFPFANAKAIQPDLHALRSGVWVAHEEPLGLDGVPTGATGGAVTSVRLTADAFGLLPLTPRVAGAPQLRGLGFEVAYAVGEPTLTGVPVDLAFDDQVNVTALLNAATPFSAGSSAANGKNLAKFFGLGSVVPVSKPAHLFVAVPSSFEGPGVVDVLDLTSKDLPRVDTNPFAPGVQSVPASGVAILAGYLRQ